MVHWDVPGVGGEEEVKMKKGGRWGVYWGDGWVVGSLGGLVLIVSGGELGWEQMRGSGGGREGRRRVGEAVGRLGGRVWWVLRGERRETRESEREGGREVVS